MNKAALVIILFALASFAMAQESIWRFDKAHTNVGFKITHMVISDVTGKFQEFDGTLKSGEDDFDGASVEFTIQTASVNTNNEKRDKHLRSKDFFDAKNYPEIKFVSKSFKKTGDNAYKVIGNLTMHGVTKEVTLELTHKGTITDPWGKTRAGFKTTTTLNRYEYGLKYNSAIESGGLLIGKEVQLEINAEIIKQ